MASSLRPGKMKPGFNQVKDMLVSAASKNIRQHAEREIERNTGLEGLFQHKKNLQNFVDKQLNRKQSISSYKSYHSSVESDQSNSKPRKKPKKKKSDDSFSSGSSSDEDYERNSKKEIQKLKSSSNQNETSLKESLLDEEERGDSEKGDLGKKNHLARQYTLIQPNHPGVCFFHLVFKIFGVFAYVFLGIVISNTLTHFLMVFLSIVFDFWVTKNITGRHLIGMRWWNDYNDEDTEEEWTFESYDYELNFSPIDVNVFWWALGINTIFWTIMFVLKALGLNFLWGLLTFIGCLLNGLNLWGYYRCLSHHKEKMADKLANLQFKDSID